MRNAITAACVASLFVLSPFALAGGLLPVNPLLNGNFDTYVTPGAASALRGVTDRCLGVGHQVLEPFYGEGGDAAIESVNYPDTAPDNAPIIAAYAGEWASSYAADPNKVHECDPGYNEVAMLNAWEKTRDRGFAWSNDPGTLFDDFDGDGDLEAIIPKTPVSHSHNMWQTLATPTQAFSANFDSFDFVIESGTPAPGANIQIGLSLTPSYMQHPWVGIFWEGAVLFPNASFQPDANGFVSMDPVVDGEIICPANYSPCTDFKADYAAADPAGKRALLGQTRIIQTSFWSFHNGVAPVAIDSVAIVGSTSIVETPPTVNPGA